MNSDITLNFKSLVGIVLVVLAICVGAYFFGSMGSKSDAERYAQEVVQYRETVVKPALAQMDDAKKIAESAVARANVSDENSKKLTVQIAGLRGQAGNLQTSAAELSARNKFLLDSIGKLAGPVGEVITGLREEVQIKDSIIIVQGHIITLDSTQHNIDMVTIANLRVGVTKQTERADKAEQLIKSWPVPPTPKKVFGITIPVPTRTQMFIVGVVTGVASSQMLRK